MTTRLNIGGMARRFFISPWASHFKMEIGRIESSGDARLLDESVQDWLVYI